MITLHHLRVGRSIFTVWLLEEVGVEYTLNIFDRNQETMRAPTALKEMHPLGKSPVIDDDGLLLSESGAITNYILDKYDSEHQFSPAYSSPKRPTYMQWLMYPEGSLFTPVILKGLTLRGGDHPLITPFSEAELELHFDYIGKQLNGNAFILGDALSGADFALSGVLSMAKNMGLLESHSNLSDYVERLMARDAFARAIKAAGA